MNLCGVTYKESNQVQVDVDDRLHVSSRQCQAPTGKGRGGPRDSCWVHSPDVGKKTGTGIAVASAN